MGSGVFVSQGWDKGVGGVISLMISSICVCVFVGSTTVFMSGSGVWAFFFFRLTAILRSAFSPSVSRRLFRPMKLVSIRSSGMTTCVADGASLLGLCSLEGFCGEALGEGPFGTVVSCSLSAGESEVSEMRGIFFLFPVTSVHPPPASGAGFVLSGASAAGFGVGLAVGVILALWGQSRATCPFCRQEKQ